MADHWTIIGLSLLGGIALCRALRPVPVRVRKRR